MSDLVCSAINSFIEPPFQTAAVLATASLLNILAPRIISTGGYYAIHATLPVVSSSSCSSSTSLEKNKIANNDDQQELVDDDESSKENTNQNQNTNNNSTTTAGVVSSSSVRKTSASNPNLARVSIAQRSRLAYKPLTEGFANLIFQWADTSEFATSLHFRLVRGGDPKTMEKNITDTVNRAQYAKKIYFQQGSLNGVDLSKCFANAKMIEEIYFMNTPTPQNISELSSVAPNLKILYCSCADLIDNEAIIKFCEGRKKLFENSKSSHPTSLHKLLLWKCPKINSIEAIQAIASLPALEILSIRRCSALMGNDFERINACFAALSTIPRLRDFDVEATLSDTALRHIGEGLPLLKKLYFYACSGVKDCTVDRGFYHMFKGLHQIEEFSVSEMPPAALEELARCKTLRILKLYDCDIKDKDLACLNALEKLEALQLAHCDSFSLPSSGDDAEAQEEEEEEQQQEQQENENDKQTGNKNKKSGFSQVSNGNLKRLVLNYCRGIRSDIYSEIASSFPLLKELNIFTAEAPVRNEDLLALSQLSNLEDLLLNDVSRNGTVTKEGIKYLGRSNLKSLCKLDLSGTEWTGLTQDKIWKIIDQN